MEEPRSGTGKHILLVDDEIQVTVMGQEILEFYGYTVTASNNSMSALESFRSQPSMFDLVITDELMPTLTGMDMAREMKTVRADVPIILWTGLTSPAVEKEAKEIGIQGFILKPIKADQLYDTISQVLHPEPQGKE